MSLEINIILGKKCVSLPITPNEQSLSHIIALIVDRRTHKCIASKTVELNSQ